MVTLEHPAVAGILYDAMDDYLPFSLIEQVVQDEHDAWWSGRGLPTPEDVKGEVLAVCRFLAEEGLIRFGRLRKFTQEYPTQLIPWEGNADDIVQRIEREWDVLRSPEAFDAFTDCWLEITADGMAEAALLPAPADDEDE